MTVLLVHGVRTSATMWRPEIAHLQQRGIPFLAPDLPGHGSRMDEPWSLDEAFATIDRAVRASDGPVVLVGHSMGGLLGAMYLGTETPPPVAAFVSIGATALPHGAGLAVYRTVFGTLRRMPNHGMAVTQTLLRATLPEEAREDWGAGGYAIQAEDDALSSLADLDFEHALPRIAIPTWFVNGQFDQLRLNERLFTQLVPHAELVLVPRATHLVPSSHPRVVNAVIDLALASVNSL
ncbi:MAG: alpha/beta fold hydrolase [Microbacterium sp.]